MQQPVRKGVKKTKGGRKSSHSTTKKKHKDYGTSKLEERFAKNFLDKLGIKYVYQYEAKSIGRFYDFYCYEKNAIIEVDGDYWHSKNILYEDMTPTQKRNKRVDKLKDHWALINGIPIIRIWESDINDHPEKVIKILKERLCDAGEQKELEDKKKTREFYKHKKEDAN